MGGLHRLLASAPHPTPQTNVMSFTPKFQEVYDRLQEMIETGASDDEIQSFFQESCRALGPYERLNNLYRIRPKHAVPGEVSRTMFFRMNLMQDTYWNNRTNRDLILKMRQGGVTTFKCLEAVDAALWENGTRSAIMADTLPHVKEYFQITKLAFKWFQKDWGQFYKVSEEVDNVNALKIKETGAGLLVCTNARGLSLDRLHIAEAAFIDDQEIKDSIAAVPLSGQVTMETTADTASGYFYDVWEQSSKDPTAMWKNHFYEWWIRYPEPQDIPFLKSEPDFKFTDEETLLVKENELTKEHIIWRRMRISEAKGDVGEFLRNYPEDPMTCFLSGSSSVFPPDVLVALWNNERAPAFVGDLIIK